jgi:hypothetical protein
MPGPVERGEVACSLIVDLLSHGFCFMLLAVGSIHCFSFAMLMVVDGHCPTFLFH